MNRSKTDNRTGQYNQQTGHVRRFNTGVKWLAGTAAGLLIAAFVWLPRENQAGAPEITVYKSPTCGCCSKWVDHMEKAGFKVVSHDRQDMNQIKAEHGVDYALRSCHTALVDGYVIEGHVPAADIRRLLQERPAMDGLAVPGMPAGPPGMEGRYAEPYDVIAFTKGKKSSVFEKH